MALSVTEQELYDFARESVPRFLFAQVRSEEEINALVKVFDRARTQVVAYFDQALILKATDQPPDWLNQHAVGRGTSRQASETDAALRDRLRKVEDAITRPILLSVANGILTAESLAAIAGMSELRYDRAFLGTNDADTAANGGEFFGVAPGMEFKPSQVPQIYSKGVSHGSTIGPRIVGSHLVISGAAAAGNNGDFVITGLNGDKMQYQNATGVAAVDGTATWVFNKYDASGNKLDGSAKSYLGRGHRMGGKAQTIIVILPFGCTSGTQAAVVEALRLKRGAGIATSAECRLNP